MIKSSYYTPRNELTIRDYQKIKDVFIAKKMKTKLHYKLQFKVIYNARSDMPMAINILM